MPVIIMMIIMSFMMIIMLINYNINIGDMYSVILSNYINYS